MPDSQIQKLSVVVPCFNEESNLKRFPAEVIVPLSQMVPSLELILVDDGSTDTSYNSMQNISEEFPNVLVVRHAMNGGLGVALRSGIEVATGDALLTLDGDLTFHPRELPSLIAAFDPSIDCVMGSPFQGRMDNVHPVRKFLSWSVNKIYAVLLGENFSSVSSIFRLYRTKKLKDLELHCRSFDINAEILFKLLASGSRAVEVPVTLGNRLFGVSKINVEREIRNHIKMFLKILSWKVGLG